MLAAVQIVVHKNTVSEIMNNSNHERFLPPDLLWEFVFVSGLDGEGGGGGEWASDWMW